MKTVDSIIKLQKKEVPKKVINRVSSLIASLFSIIFSMSIIKETSNFIQEWYIIALLIVFIVLFLVFNEYRKVVELRQRFLGKSSSLFIIILTFIVSLSLSGIGIYLWTNKTLEKEVNNDKISVSERVNVENKYNYIIDSINALDPYKNEEFAQLRDNLKYWTGRSAASLDERTYIREQIEVCQNNLRIYHSKYKEDKANSISRYEELKEAELSSVSVDFKSNKKFINRANKISFIFFIMVIMTELIIILLAKEHYHNYKKDLDFSKGKMQSKFLSEYRAITDILLRKDEITYADIVFSPYFTFPKGKDEKSKKVTSIFYFLGELGILKLPLEEAQNKLKNYYETILNI